MTNSVRPSPANNIAGPRQNWLLGNLLDFQRDPIKFLHNTSTEHGDFVKLRFAHIKAYFVNHPDFIEEILLRSAELFDKDTRSARKIRATCGNSLLSGSTGHWSRHRAIIQPVFQPRFIADTGTAIDRQLDEMLVQWSTFAKDGKAINLNEELMTLVMNITIDVLFGQEIDTVSFQKHLKTLIDDTWRRIGAVLDTSEVSPAFHRQKFKTALQNVDQLALSIITKRRQRQNQRNDLLERLLQAHSEKSALHFNDTELRDALVTLVLSGHDTTANAISWACYHIATAKDDKYKSTDPALIFQEAVRLYPSIWILERRAIDTINIGSHKIPKNAMVLISPYILHRHPEFWDNPNRFDPRRFSPESISARPRKAYIPFGLGKHRCVGIHLANLIAQKAIHAINQNFQMKLVQSPAPAPIPSLTLGINNQMRVHLIERTTLEK